MTENRNNIPYYAECGAILDACREVNRSMGTGFTEPVYQECLALELNFRGIPFTREPSICIHYKGHELEKLLRPDFICFNIIIVELKAVERLLGEHKAQLLNYLFATGYELGLLVNLGRNDITFERIPNFKTLKHT